MADGEIPAPPQMEVGDTGTAKVSFKDVNGADVELSSVTWTATGGVTINPPAPVEEGQPAPDPATANLTATAPGRAHIKATVSSAKGHPAEAGVEIRVIETGTPVVGKIDFTVSPPTPPTPPTPPAA